MTLSYLEQERTLVLQIAAATIFHPVKYAQVLIQIGYEPTPAIKSSSTILVLDYIALIERSDGFLGCYRGLTPALLAIIAANKLPLQIIQETGMDLPEVDIVTDGEPIMENYLKFCRREMIIHSISIIVSHPFHVICIRMMASFVGKEKSYCSFPGAVAAVYRDNGICGFFHGIIPKLLADLSCVVISGFLAYHVNKYLVKTKIHRFYTMPVLTAVTSFLMYPLLVVSTCMVVSESSLSAGNPPAMPLYPCWRACWMDLLKSKQLMRGCSGNIRYA